MRHGKRVPKLGRTAAHRKAMLRNMVTDLFRHERIETTLPKAKALRPLAEKMVTLGKRGDLHARRQALAVVRDKGVVHKLFTELAERYKDRQGGYVRILKLGYRRGDNAPMALVEMVDAPVREVPSEGE
ncbi:MAG: 50S ribosomal protein L17 [Aquificota bacterium]|uniref:Large ribosomal subunit protein bL17 n=1 Tax=Thermosulfidibacter takaii TaxID=412593 RepID=A0A7C0Y8T7_9BACT|nr:MAG: 50S ribosomal protein L17 [Aquificota bacterium]RLD98927.1 MAG: 50S ribosomal protein L17 [Aquificota bacterium]HDD52837.1 50S ribosomal protein L17 [Thermosulfidibacter takaii]